MYSYNPKELQDLILGKWEMYPYFNFHFHGEDTSRHRLYSRLGFTDNAILTLRQDTRVDPTGESVLVGGRLYDRLARTLDEPLLLVPVDERFVNDAIRSYHRGEFSGATRTTIIVDGVDGVDSWKHKKKAFLGPGILVPQNEQSGVYQKPFRDVGKPSCGAKTSPATHFDVPQNIIADHLLQRSR
jgi:hypothetical protein